MAQTQQTHVARRVFTNEGAAAVRPSVNTTDLITKIFLCDGKKPLPPSPQSIKGLSAFSHGPSSANATPKLPKGLKLNLPSEQDGKSSVYLPLMLSPQSTVSQQPPMQILDTMNEEQVLVALLPKSSERKRLEEVEPRQSDSRNEREASLTPQIPTPEIPSPEL